MTIEIDENSLRKAFLENLRHPLVDNFRTFEWPRASDLEELVAGSRV